MENNERRRTMESSMLTTVAADARIERYRRAERALWEHYGLAPTERFIDLESPRVRLRVLEVGSGEPVLFVPGTAGTGRCGLRSSASCGACAV